MSPGGLADEINRLYDENKNKYNFLINWDAVKMNQKRLVDIAGIIGGKKVSKILFNYSKDYKYWNHGMPDLILWDKESGRVKFSEVKSETDVLSEVQVAWLNFFTENDIDCEVCYINRPNDEQE
mgnify:CR=1 FL=1